MLCIIITIVPTFSTSSYFLLYHQADGCYVLSEPFFLSEAFIVNPLLELITVSVKMKQKRMYKGVYQKYVKVVSRVAL